MTRVLLVDDAMFMRMMLKGILENNGFKVVGEAGDGSEAVQKYDILKPDVVLMDITMPNMSGIESLKTIKAMHPDAKIIMCSAMGQKSMVVDSLQYGASDFIVKPFNEDRVVEAIVKTMKK